MRKVLLMLFMSVVCLGAFAEKSVTVKAGTLIPLQAVNGVEAANVKIGDKVLFRVSRDVMIDGVTAISYGTMVNGKVIQAKKSSWWGTKGRLGINISELVMPNGTVIPLQNGQIQINGKNRTTLSVVLSLFVLPACFICGSKAEMSAGYEVEANVAANTELKIE